MHGLIFAGFSNFIHARYPSLAAAIWESEPTYDPAKAYSDDDFTRILTRAIERTGMGRGRSSSSSVASPDAVDDVKATRQGVVSVSAYEGSGFARIGATSLRGRVTCIGRRSNDRHRNSDGRRLGDPRRRDVCAPRVEPVRTP